MKKLLIVATLSIAVAAVIKRVTEKFNRIITIGDIESYPDWVKRDFLNI